jgi:methanogenic corrinoid protein MtbC1
MPKLKDHLHKALSDAVLAMEEENTVAISKTIVERKMDAYQAIENGLSDGMNRATTMNGMKEVVTQCRSY